MPNKKERAALQKALDTAHNHLRDRLDTILSAETTDEVIENKWVCLAILDEWAHSVQPLLNALAQPDRTPASK